MNKTNVKQEVHDLDGKLCVVELTTTFRVSRFGEPENEFDCLGKAQDSIEGNGSGEGYEILPHVARRTIKEVTGTPECVQCESEWREDGYAVLVQWQGHIICNDCREGAQSEMCQATWENANRHIWDNQH